MYRVWSWEKTIDRDRGVEGVLYRFELRGTVTRDVKWEEVFWPKNEPECPPRVVELYNAFCDGGVDVAA